MNEMNALVIEAMQWLVSAFLASCWKSSSFGVSVDFNHEEYLQSNVESVKLFYPPNAQQFPSTAMSFVKFFVKFTKALVPNDKMW